MNVTCPRVVISGTGSGVGKTSLALGLARLLKRRGLRVQTYKVGPDFLDPTYLTLASGRPCYNLDGWMTAPQYVARLFAQTSDDADVAVIEGVMGLFDGASSRGLEGSTAEIAVWLKAPVILVAGVHGVARSLAATAQGFSGFHPDVNVAGVIGNRGGSPRHRRWLSQSLADAGGPPLVGMVPRESLPELPSRHLGLVTAKEAGLDCVLLDQLADACERHLDVDEVLRCARRAVPLEVDLPEARSVPRRFRLGIARDAAFQFYYPDNLNSLRCRGVQWVEFSPLADRGLPSDLDGLYFGGGYPELHADRLAENRELLTDVRDFSASGRCIHAECGGLMYLGRSLATLEGRRFPMASVLPLETAMLPRRKALGYTEVSWLSDTPWGATGQTARGHEFHYSEIQNEDAVTQGWQPAFTLARRQKSREAGFFKGQTLASYVHLHWASRPDMLDHFLASLKGR